MKIYLKIIVFIFFTSLFLGCTERISYGGKIFNLSENINNFKIKEDVLKFMGYPNYIDPIEKKYFYYSDKQISKNFFDTKIVERKLIVFHFNDNNTIKSIDEFYLDDENKIKLINDQTPSEMIKPGLLKKIFGGVGTSTTPMNP